MRRFWADVTEPIMRTRGFSRVVEIGSQSGENSRRLLELCKAFDAHADIIDPVPPTNQEQIQDLLDAHGTLHLALSLDVLGDLPVADIYLIDGDHNWHTVHNELCTIDDRVRAADARLPLILMHDVGWPYGRRDQYYTPKNVPKDSRLPYVKGGLHPDRAEVDPDGGMNRHQPHARTEGGPKNGVRTAVDDFLALRPDRYRWFSIPLFHGYGFLVPVAELDAPYAKTIQQICEDNPAFRSLAARVERSRVESLIALEDARYARQAARARVAELERANSALKAEVSGLKTKLAAIEGSRGYRALEEARNVWRRVRRGPRG